MILSIEHRGTETRRKIYFYEYPQLANVGAGFARLYVSTWMFSGRQTLPLQVIGIMYDRLLIVLRKLYSQSEMNCEKSFVMLNEVKHLGCAHVDVHEILHVRSG